MSRVREATLEDLDFLIGKAVAFNKAYYDVPVDLDKLELYLINLIVHPEGIILRTDTGAITGIIVDDPVRNWKALVETAWYSEGRDGLRLLRDFKEYGVSREVDEIRMTTLTVNSGVERILYRNGYRPIETSHRLLI